MTWATVLLRRWRDAPVALKDLTGSALFFLVAALPIQLPGVELGELDRSPAPGLVLLLTGLQTLPLAARRTQPGVALGAVCLGFAAAQLLGADTGIAGLGLFVALYSAAARQRGRRLATAALVAAGYGCLAVALHLLGSTERLLDWITFAIVLAAPSFAGSLVRARLAGQAEREEEAAARAVADVRAQLARDLHDVVTHHVTGMIVQAESAAYLAADDTATREDVLRAIGTSGRRALSDLRALLDVIDPIASETGSVRGPVPVDMAEIVTHLAAAGYPVTWAEDGAPRQIPPDIGVVLGRVVQEALTNCQKHAPGAPVTVRVHHARDSVEVQVSNEVTTSSTIRPGRGLRGMRDRLALVGGNVDVDTDVEGILTVAVHVPLGTSR